MDNKRILLVDLPFTIVQKELCPREKVSIETLKILSFLRKNNSVFFVQTKSKDRFSWKKRRAGRFGKEQITTIICSKSLDMIRKEFSHISNTSGIDDIILLCQMPLAPYSFDEDVVLKIKSITEEVFPGKQITLAGNFIEQFPEFAEKVSLIKDPRIILEKIISEIPDFSENEKGDEGIFQISYGCSNNCSFCTNPLNKPQKIPIEIVIRYMKEYAEKYSPEYFSNWDPNVLMFPGHLKQFLDAYKASGINVPLRFELGFQPDKIDDELIRKLADVGTQLITVPFETGSVKSYSEIRKPYTIISSMKKMVDMRRYADRLGKLQNSFIIGYSHDDFNSIFRIYLSILKLGGVPLPFSLFVFPRTKEYEQNIDILKNKSFSEFHGELWPLIEEDKIAKYQNLLTFLKIRTLEEALSRMDLLDYDLKERFLEELAINDRFVDLCLNSPDESVQALLRIETEILSTKAEKNILYITASPKPEEKSISKELGSYLLKKLERRYGSVKINELDLYSHTYGFIDEEYLDIIYKNKSYKDVSENTQRINSFAEESIRLLRQSDIIVIATPMWTLSIPSILKSFFEMVASKLFYEYNQQLCKKKIFCILSRDGRYPNSKQINSQETTLTGALDFIGVGKEITFIIAQGTIQSDILKTILSDTKKEIDKLFED